MMEPRAPVCLPSEFALLNTRGGPGSCYTGNSTGLETSQTKKQPCRGGALGRWWLRRKTGYSHCCLWLQQFFNTRQLQYPQSCWSISHLLSLTAFLTAPPVLLGVGNLVSRGIHFRPWQCPVFTAMWVTEWWQQLRTKFLIIESWTAFSRCFDF